MPRIIIIAGPTASGKSELAFSIAEKCSGVIINADSQQIYRELPILTARPTVVEEARIPHRLYGFLPVSEPCSAGKWLNLARMEIDWTLSQAMVPIVTGGTGLYLKALLHGIAEMPDIAPEVRLQASNDYDAMGKEAFAERLKAVDPDFFDRLKSFDQQRLIRAYEVWLGSGKSLSWWQGQGVKPIYPADYFTIYQVDLPRDELYRRCNQRFLNMIEQGAIEEVRQFQGSELGTRDSGIIGVKELSAYLRQEIILEQAISASQQATRNYAKRQLTWFRHQLKGAISIDSRQLSKNFHI